MSHLKSHSLFEQRQNFNYLAYNARPNVVNVLKAKSLTANITMHLASTRVTAKLVLIK